MALHHELGSSGEATAVRFLQANGYKILCTNWRHGHLEIDIVATIDNCLVVVEVKTRKRSGIPVDEILTENKRRNLLAATGAYVAASRWQGETRIDLIVIGGPSPQIDHYPAAVVPY